MPLFRAAAPRPRPRRLPALLTTALAGLLAVTLAALPGSAATAGTAGRTAAPAAAPAFVPAPIEWDRCADPFLAMLGLQCGFLVVPMDYDDPAGPTVELALSRLRHTSAPSEYQGVMLTNPGGPGGAGRWMAALGTAVPRGAGEFYDWIGMDPRGVGDSRPRVQCDRTYNAGVRPGYVPSGRDEVARWLRRTTGYAAACDASSARALLDHTRTSDVVQDLESLRLALSVEQVNYYGYSYGSYLGQAYATAHPDRVRRMVLDANVDARQVWYAANQAQAVGFQRTMRRFYRFVAQWWPVFRLGRSGSAVRKAYEQELRQLRRRPVRGFDAADLTDAFLPAGYSSALWPVVADAFRLLHNKDRFRVMSLLAGRGGDLARDNSYAMYLATTCTDAPWPAEWSTWSDDAWRLHDRAPFAAWANTWFNSPCRTWPVESSTPPAVDGSGVSGPVLLAGSSYDAPTPFAGSLETRRRFPTASLVELAGSTDHGASLNGNRCVDLIVAAYLRRGVVPQRQEGDRSDATCAATPPLPDFGFGDGFRVGSGRESGSRTASALSRADRLRLALLKAGIPGR